MKLHSRSKFTGNVITMRYVAFFWKQSHLLFNVVINHLVVTRFGAASPVKAGSLTKLIIGNRPARARMRYSSLPSLSSLSSSDSSSLSSSPSELEELLEELDDVSTCPLF